MNNILRIYYSLLFFLLIDYAGFFINYTPWSSVKQLPYSEVSYLLKLLNPHPPIWILTLLFLPGLVFSFLCIFNPKKYLKIITSVFICITFRILYSYGYVGHHNHIWMLSSVLMVFFSSDQSLKSKNNLFIIRLTQAMLLCHYFISGLWKIRTLISENFSLSFKELLLEIVAYANTARAFEFHPFVKILLYKHPELLSFGYFFAVLFQITALLPVFFPRFIIPYGVLAILFHFSVGLTAGIYFSHTVLAILFFLIIVEPMINETKKEP